MDELVKLGEVLAILYKAKHTDIDAEEEVRKLSDAVVRCKDCKWLGGYDNACYRYADETGGIPHSTQDDFYCAMGDRRKDDKH